MASSVCPVAAVYFVTDFVAWNVAFDNVVETHTFGELNVTLRVVVVV